MGRLVFVSLAVLLTTAAVVFAGPSSSRIVGGKDAEIGQFPFQVSLQREDGSHSCGGSILNENFILTAAHCVVVGNGVEAYPPKFYQVRVGSIQRTVGGRLLKLKRVIVHQGYGNFYNDVALLELEEPLTFTENIQPIEMADQVAPIGEPITVSGWGRLCTTCEIPYRLQWTTLTNFSLQECDALIGDIDITENFICLAHPKDNGVCFGDSGGPATYNGKLVGVAGFVADGCGSTYPDGYGSVVYHRDWILEKMGL